MVETGFPVGNYTPFGYVSNYDQVAWSWEHVSGGTLRTARDFAGFGWVYPTERRVESEFAIGFGIAKGHVVALARGDLAKLGYHSRYHSANIFSYNFDLDGIKVDSRYFQADRDVLVCFTTVSNETAEEQEVLLLFVGSAVCREGAVCGRVHGASIQLTEGDSQNEHRAVLVVSDIEGAKGTDNVEGASSGWRDDGGGIVHGEITGSMSELSEVISSRVDRRGSHGDSSEPVEPNASRHVIMNDREIRGILLCRWRLAPSESRLVVGALFRGNACAEARTGLATLPAPYLKKWEKIYRSKVEADVEFYSGCPVLFGDWPESWKHGFVYDMETTRMCTFPPGGVFKDCWPSWMISYPRVVLAEGSLDMMRLAYAAPDVAKRAILTMFRDAPLPNVPCMHQQGQFNMVAADGSCCGTSPAWCLPLYNICLVYLRTGDKTWLDQLYPYVERFVRWWLTYRTDDAGWVNYKCTWEAGEDCTPRLDPEQTGDNVVSGVIRPVELQAAMAQSAHIAAFFAQELGKLEEARKWRTVEADYTYRTRQLFDEQEGRFRDWDCRTNSFLAVRDDVSYWKDNPLRYSPLSLLPLILGVATPEQVRRMEPEVRHYSRPPWCEWPSWTFVVEEAATWSGLHDFASENAYRILSRVYAENDRRNLDDWERPLPGVAREYWPSDLADFRGSDGYAWGAVTAQLLLRQIVGFLESFTTETNTFELLPNLPEPMFREGYTYGVRNLAYRGLRFDLTEQVADGGVRIRLEFSSPVHLAIQRADGSDVRPERTALVHEWAASNRTRYRVTCQG